MDTFLLLHRVPWCIQPVESEKTQPQLLANLVVATNYTGTVHHDKKQQKIARVNRYSAPTVAHQGACSSVLPPLDCHLKFLHTFALKIPSPGALSPPSSAPGNEANHAISFPSPATPPSPLTVGYKRFSRLCDITLNSKPSIL